MFQSELPKHPGTPARQYSIVDWGYSWGRVPCVVGVTDYVAALRPTSRFVAGRRNWRVDVAGRGPGAGRGDAAKTTLSKSQASFRAAAYSRTSRGPVDRAWRRGRSTRLPHGSSTRTTR